MNLFCVNCSADFRPKIEKKGKLVIEYKWANQPTRCVRFHWNVLLIIKLCQTNISFNLKSKFVLYFRFGRKIQFFFSLIHSLYLSIACSLSLSFALSLFLSFACSFARSLFAILSLRPISSFSSLLFELFPLSPPSLSSTFLSVRSADCTVHTSVAKAKK